MPIEVVPPPSLSPSPFPAASAPRRRPGRAGSASWPGPPAQPPAASPPAARASLAAAVSTIIFRTPSSISPYSRMTSISARMASATGPSMSLATSIAWAADALLILIPRMISARSASVAALQWVSDQIIHSSARA